MAQKRFYSRLLCREYENCSKEVSGGKRFGINESV